MPAARKHPLLPGETEADRRRRLARERMRAWRGNPDNEAQEDQRRRRSYAENREAERAKKNAYHAANRHVQRSADRRRYEKHAETLRANTRQWVAANMERHQQAKAAWVARNRARVAAYSARWRRSCREATPPWADHRAIQRFYDLAADLTASTGVPHEVDHIVPVQGRAVRGLHVETNLRVIPASQNCTKRNRFDPHLLEILIQIEVWT